MEKLPTPLQWKQNKRSKVCSLEAYDKLVLWYYSEKYHRNRIDITKTFYTKTAHREFLSKWLEAVIKSYMRWDGWEVAKPEDKGRQIIKDGKPLYIKQRSVKSGTADIIAKKALGGVGSLIVNIEVKVGKDTQSEAQKKEEQRALNSGELYYIVKTLDDFFEVNEKVNLILNDYNVYTR
jgi:hypothetical protein